MCVCGEPCHQDQRRGERAYERALVYTLPKRDAQRKPDGDDTNHRLNAGPDPRFATRESDGPQQADENHNLGDDKSAYPYG